jgi:hypothetical protein
MGGMGVLPGSTELDDVVRSVVSDAKAVQDITPNEYVRFSSMTESVHENVDHARNYNSDSIDVYGKDRCPESLGTNL